MQISDQKMKGIFALFFLVLQLPILFWPGPLLLDEGVYTLTALLVQKGHQLYSEIPFAQPPLLVQSLRTLPTLENVFLMGRFLYVAFALLLALSVWKVADTFLQARLSTWIPLLLLSDLFLWGSAHMVNGNLPSVAFCIFAWALILERVTGWRLLAVGFLIALGLSFKLLALPLAPAIAFWLWKKSPGSIVKSMSLVGLSLVLSFLGLNLLISPAFFLHPEQMQGGALQASVESLSFAKKAETFFRFIPLSILGEEDSLKAYWNSLFVILGITGLANFWLKSKDTVVKRTLLCLFIFPMLAFLIHKTVWPHHLLIVWPAIFVGLLALIRLLGPKGRLGVFSLLVLGLGFNIFQAYMKFPQVHRDTLNLISEIRSAIPPGSLVISDQPWIVITSGSRTYPNYADVSRIRVQSGSVRCEELIPRIAEADFFFVEKAFYYLPCWNEVGTILNNSYKAVPLSVPERELWQRPR